MAYKAIVTANSGKTVNMRYGDSTSSDVIAQLPIGTPVDVISENGEWSRIGCDGKIGYMKSEFLVKEKAEEGVYYVKIKCDSASEAKRLAELLGKATVD